MKLATRPRFSDHAHQPTPAAAPPARDDAAVLPMRAPAMETAPPALATAMLVDRRDDGVWRVRVAGAEHEASVDPAVDPRLLDEIAARAGRVLVECSPAWTIIGVVQIARALTIDRDGHVAARVESFTLDTNADLLLRAPRAFLQMKAGDIEIYGNRVLTRAREVARVLARMISLN